jgi:hypothetical protein
MTIKKPAPPQFDKKIECFHCKGLGHTRKHCNWIDVGNDCIANHTVLKRYVFHMIPVATGLCHF